MNFVVFGAGFWARFQIAAWQQLAIEGLQPVPRCVGIVDGNVEKAKSLADLFSIPNVFEKIEDVVGFPDVQFWDVISSPSSHFPICATGLKLGIPIICQKPLAENLAEAEMLHALAEENLTPLMVHENWRWQAPFRTLKLKINEGIIGRVVRCQLKMVSGFPLFQNQPMLKELDQFLLNDIGVHILDTARMLFGEAEEVFCRTQYVQSDVKGEDLATVFTRHGEVDVVSLMGYLQNPIEDDAFPQTFVFVEGTQGTIELRKNFELRITTTSGTEVSKIEIPSYSWADPQYAVIHSAMVPCLRDLYRGIVEPEYRAETTSADNLITLRLIDAAYRSAELNQVVSLK